MYYALPEHLQETTLLLLVVFYLFISRKTAGLGLLVGFSIVFKRQRTTHMVAYRDATVISHWKSHRKGHHQGSNTWLWECPPQGYHQAVTQSLGRWLHAGQMCKEIVIQKGRASFHYSTKSNRLRGPGELARVTWPIRDQRTSTQPRAIPLSSPGRCPSYCQRAYGLESLGTSVPTGLPRCLAKCKSQPIWVSVFSPVKWRGGTRSSP